MQKEKISKPKDKTYKYFIVILAIFFLILSAFLIGNILLRESIFAFKGNNIAEAIITDKTTNFRNKNGVSYDFEYEFETDKHQLITDHTIIDGYSWSFLQINQTFPVIYSDYLGYTFYRPKLLEFQLLEIYLSIFLIFITLFIFWEFKRIGNDKKDKIKKNIRVWLIYSFICFATLFISFSTLKYLLFTSSTIAKVEEIYDYDYFYAVKYGYEDKEKNNYKFIVNIKKDKNDVAAKNEIKELIELTYKNLDPKTFILFNPKKTVIYKIIIILNFIILILIPILFFFRKKISFINKFYNKLGKVKI